MDTDLESDYISANVPIEAHETTDLDRPFKEVAEKQENESANDDKVSYSSNTIAGVQETCHGEIQQAGTNERNVVQERKCIHSPGKIDINEPTGHESVNICPAVHDSQGLNNTVVAQETYREINTADNEIGHTVHAPEQSQTLEQSNVTEANPTFGEDFDGIDCDGDSCLHLALILENMGVFYYMIHTCINSLAILEFIDLKNYAYQTPLHLAVLTNNAAAVEALVSLGANILLRDNLGRTPLHIACEKNLVNLIPILLTGNTTDTRRVMSIRDFEGNTSLHVATLQENIEAIDILVTRGADINIPDVKSSRTCLHMAVEKGDLQLVKYILSLRQINVNCKTRSGDSPLVMARCRRLPDIEQLIIESDADAEANERLSDLDQSSSDEMG